MHAGKGIAALVTCECLWALQHRNHRSSTFRIAVRAPYSEITHFLLAGGHDHMHACKGMPALITTHERLWTLRHQSTSLLHRSTVFDRVRTAVRVSYGGIFLEYSATKQPLFKG